MKKIPRYLAPLILLLLDGDPTDSGRLVEFSPKSFAYSSLVNAPIDPNGQDKIDRLANTITSKWNGIAAVNAYKYNTSFFEVDSNTSTQNVKFNDCQNKGYLPSDFTPALSNVPIPPNAIPATGTDKNLTIYDRDADKLWEYWRAEKDETGQWSACWGGVIENVSQSEAVFSGMTGTAATGISFAATSISVEEARRGEIKHAMYLVVVDAKKWNDFSWPASRSDGHIDEASAMPEGRRIRLKNSINLDSLDLTPFGRAVAEAAKVYGFIVMDKGGAVAVITESGEAEKQRTGVNPWDEIFGGTPAYEQLKNFPWEHLELIEHDYGKDGNMQWLE